MVGLLLEGSCERAYTCNVGKPGPARRRKLWRRFVLTSLIAPAVIALFVWATNEAVLSGVQGRIYTSVDSVPPARAALVLGTSPLFGGNKNPFFERRMDAAAELYRAKKVQKLLVSGDNGTRYYDEPTAMRKALMQRGVPEQDIVVDYAGFHTLDSVVRAHRVFGLDRCIIVTDDFHLPRAIYIADNEKLQVVGFQTVPLPRSISPRTHFRELLSRTLIWLDINVFNRQPKFLGPRQPI